MYVACIALTYIATDNVFATFAVVTGFGSVHWAIRQR